MYKVSVQLYYVLWYVTNQVAFQNVVGIIYSKELLFTWMYGTNSEP